MIDTIRNVLYNHAERERLYNEYLRVQSKYDEMLKEYADCEDEDEAEEIFQTVCDGEPERMMAYRRCFAAQFPSCKNEWFAKVIDELNEGESKQISERQFYCFSQYAYGQDENNWRDGKQYCRVGSYLVTLTWRNSNRSIKKESIA